MRILVATCAAILCVRATHAQSPDPLAPTGRWTAYTAGQARHSAHGLELLECLRQRRRRGKGHGLGQAHRRQRTGSARAIATSTWMTAGPPGDASPDGHLMIRTDKFPSDAARGQNTPIVQAVHRQTARHGPEGRHLFGHGSQHLRAGLEHHGRGPAQGQHRGARGRPARLSSSRTSRCISATWGFDYIKVDGCGLRDFGPNSAKVKAGEARALTPIMDLGAITRTDVAAVQDLFRRVGAAIERSNPDGDFFYSLCIWGAANVRAWAKDVGNASRTSDDISPAWGRLLVNFDSAVHRALYAHPGSWNDPDMLYIGAGDFDADHLTEARSHFALWAMLNAPLLIGADLRKTPDALMEHPRQCRHHRAEPGSCRQPGDRRLRFERSADPGEDPGQWRQGSRDLQSRLRRLSR